MRPLSGDAARLTLPVALPLRAGDRAILRDPGAQRVVAGVLVVDADPPPLARRGAGARRGEELSRATGRLDLAAEVERRGAMTVDDALALGMTIGSDAESLPKTIVRQGDWLISRRSWEAWARSLRTAVEARAQADPLDPVLSVEAAREAAGIPDRALLGPLAEQVGLAIRVRAPGPARGPGLARPGGGGTSADRGAAGRGAVRGPRAS